MRRCARLGDSAAVDERPAVSFFALCAAFVKGAEALSWLFLLE